MLCECNDKMRRSIDFDTNSIYYYIMCTDAAPVIVCAQRVCKSFNNFYRFLVAGLRRGAFSVDQFVYAV